MSFWIPKILERENYFSEKATLGYFKTPELKKNQKQFGLDEIDPKLKKEMKNRDFNIFLFTNVSIDHEVTKAN